MRRGDIWMVSLDPVVGREQAGIRPVLIVSPTDFHRNHIPVVCPVTSGGAGARQTGFAVSLTATGMRTTGVVLCQFVRAVDLRARGARFIEIAPDFIIDDVLARLEAIVQ